MRPFPCETSPTFLESWRDLERRSLWRSPFLSPAFLFPQWQAAECNPKAQLLTVIDGQGRWLLAGLFEQVRGTRQLPLPHLRAVRNTHSFKTGSLVDATESQSVVETLWIFLRQQHLHGLSFPLFPVQSGLSDLLTEQCEKSKTLATVDDLQLRATVAPGDVSAMSAKRAKSLRRGRRSLEKIGRVALRFDNCAQGDLSAVERFLFLESLGWKGESQSALACRWNEVRALRTTAQEFSQQNRIHFAELTIDERVIASMCLFRSESDYYAFKIGWDPQFERGCPGFLLAAEIQENLHRLPQCERLDSCARPGSFLDHVWPGRKQIGTALFTTTAWGSAAARGARMARDLYRQWRGRAGTPDQNAAPEVPSSSEREEELA